MCDMMADLPLDIPQTLPEPAITSNKSEKFSSWRPSLLCHMTMLLKALLWEIFFVVSWQNLSEKIQKHTDIDISTCALNVTKNRTLMKWALLLQKAVSLLGNSSSISTLALRVHDSTRMGSNHEATDIKKVTGDRESGGNADQNPKWNILTTFWWTGTTFCANVYDPLKMEFNYSGYPHSFLRAVLS